MKKLFVFAFALSTIYGHAQVGIGTNAPHASAQLEVNSTDKGALMPRMTEAQRTGIVGPAAGLLVYQTDASAGFYYYTGAQWTNIANGQAATPAGTIVAFAGTTAPQGWALCSGEAISRTTYAELYTAIGTHYGSGDGSSTFNLPDLRGRTVFGKDNMGGTAATRIISSHGINGLTLGAAGGNATTTLSETNLPSHTHNFSGTSATTSSNTHSHDYVDAYFAESGGSGYGGNSLYGTSANTDHDNSFRYRTSGNGWSTAPMSIATSSSSHSHTVVAAGTISATGSGTAFNTLNPGIVLNYIIKL